MRATILQRWQTHKLQTNKVTLPRCSRCQRLVVLHSAVRINSDRINGVSNNVLLSPCNHRIAQFAHHQSLLVSSIHPSIHSSFLASFNSWLFLWGVRGPFFCPADRAIHLNPFHYKTSFRSTPYSIYISSCPYAYELSANCSSINQSFIITHHTPLFSLINSISISISIKI